MLYFNHNVSAASNDKILSLRIDCGGEAVDAYWTLIEHMYRTEKPLVISENQVETKAVCHILCTTFEKFERFVNCMLEVGLLHKLEDSENGELTVFSKHVEEALSAYKKTSETARQNGKKGGRPNAQKPKKTQLVNSEKPKKANKEEEVEEEVREEKEILKKKNSSVFQKPTIEEVESYAKEKGYDGFNAERFWHYFEAQGWRLSNGNPMRNWHSAMSNWHSRNGSKEGGDFGKYDEW